MTRSPVEAWIVTLPAFFTLTEPSAFGPVTETAPPAAAIDSDAESMRPGIESELATVIVAALPRMTDVESPVNDPPVTWITTVPPAPSLAAPPLPRNRIDPESAVRCTYLPTPVVRRRPDTSKPVADWIVMLPVVA